MAKPGWVIEQERMLIEQIEALRKSYEEAAKPYVNRLIRLRNTFPDPIYISQEQYNRMFDVPPPTTANTDEGVTK